MLDQLTTQHLVLRSFNHHDTEALFAYASDERVTAYTAWETHTHLYISQAFITKLIYSQRMLWALELSHEQTVIGECGVTELAYNSAEISCALSYPWWGKGLAYQALNALITWCFVKKKYDCLQASVITGHTRSAALAQHLGMKHTATLSQQWFVHDHLYDINLYTLTYREWLTDKNRYPEDIFYPSFQPGLYTEHALHDTKNNS